MPLSQALLQQQQATLPYACAWVNASAGTGKTKVLIDRLLALLLSGAAPEHILCLTFTKAAAAEMRHRLLTVLQQWVLESDSQLNKTLYQLTGKLPTFEQLQRARHLYTLSLDAPGGLKIETIHSFCQSLLKRFPIEAGISPNPHLLEETDATDLLDKAKRHLLTRLLQEDADFTPLLVSYFKDGSFQTVLEEIIMNRRYFRQVLHTYPTLSSYSHALCEKLDLPAFDNLLDPQLAVSYFTKAYQLSAVEHHELHTIARSQDLAFLNKWLDADSVHRFALFKEYQRFYLTQKGEMLKKLKIPCPAEAEKVYRIAKTLEVLQIAQKSACIFYLGTEIFHLYQHLKHQQNAVDYEDLIEKTIALLNQPDISPWILYKLDGGIRHLLVDEAQDTNPDQWQVILALTQEFLTPHDTPHTLFVVGDIKQSIYSFQGANPQDFLKYQQWYREQYQALGQPWYDIDLEVSFRSAPEILQIVDHLINHPHHQEAIQFTQSSTRHLPYRQSSGHIALLPAILEPKPAKNLEPWPIPDQYRLSETALDQVCQQITHKIQSLLSEKIILASTGRPVEPKDILLLVKQRGTLAPALIRALKKGGIPIAGIDRFFLTNHLAIQDLIALGKFLLLPQDDLSLACILKGPLCHFSEEDLRDLAAPRQGTLWHELKTRHSEKEIYHQAYQFLKSLLTQVDYLTPYHLYHHILFKEKGFKKFRYRFGPEADDPLNEFLAYAFQICHGQAITLQQFLGIIEKANPEIKRDGADNTQNQVRLMTVHGAKGLQAPIVFIIEKFNQRSSPYRLLWDKQSPFMMIRPSLSLEIPYTHQLKALETYQEECEDKRLLYVALTRAQDYLFLTGYGEKDIPDHSWYQWLSAYVPVQAVKQVPSSYSPDVVEETEKSSHWLNHPVRHRKFSTVPVEPVTSLTSSMQKGIIIHQLFEFLWDLSPSDRLEAAHHFLQKHKFEQPIPIEEIIALLDCDVLKTFNQGIAEMEIITPNGELQRLDRVVIDNNCIKILDFKTSSFIPASARLTPSSILTQLRGYVSAMQQVYPHHVIECYVLWTSGPTLHYIPSNLLAQKTPLSSAG